MLADDNDRWIHALPGSRELSMVYAGVDPIYEPVPVRPDFRNRHDAAEAFASRLRDEMNLDPQTDPLELFDHVFADPTPQLREQRAQLASELEG